MKPIKSAAMRAHERAQSEEQTRIAGVRADLTWQLEQAGWKNISVRHRAIFYAVSGDDPAGVNHSAALEDGQAIVDFLISIGIKPKSRDTDPLATLENAAAAVDRLREAAKPHPVSSIDRIDETEDKMLDQTRTERSDLFSNTTPEPSPALRVLFLPDETIPQAVSRLTPALRLEWDEVNNLVIDKAGGRRLESGKTAQQRFEELTALLDELAELGAQAERA